MFRERHCLFRRGAFLAAREVSGFRSCVPNNAVQRGWFPTRHVKFADASRGECISAPRNEIVTPALWKRGESPNTCGHQEAPTAEVGAFACRHAVTDGCLGGCGGPAPARPPPLDCAERAFLNHLPTGALRACR